MIPFDLWSESLKFGIVYFIIIAIPCYFLAIVGKKVVNELGTYPTRTPLILMSKNMMLYIITGSISIFLLIGFYYVLSD